VLADAAGAGAEVNVALVGNQVMAREVPLCFELGATAGTPHWLASVV
jgi:hypothetical protein